jgi:phosphoribosyl-ATP pyrophosphohydrolase
MTETTTQNKQEDGRAKANKAQFRPMFDLLAFHKAAHQKLLDNGAEQMAKRHVMGQDFAHGNDTAQLRAQLITEEARELRNALLFEDKAQVLKEAMDLLYVTFGTLATYDLPLTGPWNEVHANNMAKMEKGGVDGSGKITKPRNHPKVDLKEYVK